MITLIFYFVSSHAISFICSILESVLLCTTTSYIPLLKKKNPGASAILNQLKSRIDRPLAAILTLNTGAHTFGAAGIGAQVVELYGSYWLGIVTIILTLTMLFLTEMIPKTLGALYWKKLAPFSAYFIKILIFLTYPFVIAFEVVAKILSRNAIPDKVTEEEIKLMLIEATQSGVIHETEHEMMESIFRLGDRRVNILMTPRLDIEWINAKDKSETILEKMEKSPFSIIPMCEDNLDNVVGIIRTKDVLKGILEKGSIDFKTYAKAPLFVPENMRVLQLVELFKKKGDYFALVTDEYGGIQGLVTLHDILESIVGELPQSALEAFGHPILQRKDGSWLIDGMLPIDEFKSHFHIEEFPDEEKGSYRTIAGFCMRQLGSIPQIGDFFMWNNLRFKIIKMDGRRVEKILLYDYR